MSLELFHPLIQRWFLSRFKGPTDPQQQGWPHIAAGENTLIAAPTGSGKTLTAFLSAIDRLLKRAIDAPLPDDIRVVYISPLRALSNDMHRNLEQPLEEILNLAASEGLEITPIRAGLRTGDSTPSQRAALLRKPPQILVTTPESLYLLVTSVKGRAALANVETVIVDEIHALVRDKRGSHLALTLERLEALCPGRLQRIGLSATQRPIERVAEFLVGVPTQEEQVAPGGRESFSGGIESSANALGASPPKKDSRPLRSDPPSSSTLAPAPDCAIVDVGHQRDLDLGIEVPSSDLGAVCMHEQWAEVNQRLCELINAHRSTLIFVNNRRLAERLTHQLTELLGEDAVSSHHGSLAADRRHDTEQRLKTGRLKAVVATASLELGLDIGYIDLVIQIGSPRSIATFLQRVGRSGHALGLVPKGRLVALTRDELLECLALLRAIRGGRLDTVPIPVAPLDILAQQLVAEVACAEQNTDELFDRFRRAYPYRNLLRADYDRVIKILAEGMTPEAGRGRVYIHHDLVGRRLRPRPGARIAACSSGGAIPEIASYRVVAEPDRTIVGTLDEEFAAESQAGEIFLLGNTSWRIQYVRGGEVLVSDAHGAPPSIPFWRGEAPGRTIELSEEVSRLREDLEQRCDDLDAAVDWLTAEAPVNLQPAQQIVEYVAAQKAALGVVPSQKNVVFERFFDESGGMQMVIHAPFGSRITKAWGLAMRKRFCRSFDFELQASADDDGIVLSLGPQHSFPLESMFPMLNAGNAQNLLEQALLAVPTFQTRWRWNVIRALQVLRHRNGKKVPPHLLRMRADDLLTAVFPKLTGCQENIVGDHEIPDHPLTKQSMHDSLQEAHDLEGLLDVLRRIGAGEITMIARDTREPSPFSYELLNANPYAFLDGGEAVERRARAVATRRSLTVESVQDLGRLDPNAIRQVRQDAQPYIRNADELHDVLLSRIAIPETSAPTAATAQADEDFVSPFAEDFLAYRDLFAELQAARRATSATVDDRRWWVATERWPAFEAVFPGVTANPSITVPPEVRRDWPQEEARVTLIRGLLEISGPITVSHAAAHLGITDSQTDAALQALEGEGVVLRGRFTPQPAPGEISFDQVKVTSSQNGDSHSETEWCHRRLLARIHRLTMEGLRKQIEPVTTDIFIRFLLRHHGIIPAFRRGGANGLFETVAQLQGLDIPAVAWERDILPSRLDRYRSEWLDELCLTGEIGWGRLFPPKRLPDRSRPMASLTRVVPLSLYVRGDLGWLRANAPAGEVESLSSPAQEVHQLLERQGAMFAADVLNDTRLLPTQLNDILGELVSQGLVTADGFAGLRTLLAARSSEPQQRFRASMPRKRLMLSGSGRWSLWRRDPQPAGELTPSEARAASEELLTHWAWQLLRRWGVMFRDLLEQEDGAPRWWELLPIFRRLEARGEIRGGRFIVGVAGEQFALGETVRALRQIRDEAQSAGTEDNKKPQEELVVISAADPLNLAGLITPHDRIPRVAGNRVAYLNGVPVAALVAQEVRYFGNPSPQLRKRIDGGKVFRHGTIGDAELVSDDHPPESVEVLEAVSSGDVGSNSRQEFRFSKDGLPKSKPQKSLFPNSIPRPYPG